MAQNNFFIKSDVVFVITDQNSSELVFSYQSYWICFDTEDEELIFNLIFFANILFSFGSSMKTIEKAVELNKMCFVGSGGSGVSR